MNENRTNIHKKLIAGVRQISLLPTLLWCGVGKGWDRYRLGHRWSLWHKYLRLMYGQATVRSYTCGKLRRPHWTWAFCVLCGGKGAAAHAVRARRCQATTDLPELLHSLSRYNATRESERKRWVGAGCSVS